MNPSQMQLELMHVGQRFRRLHHFNVGGKLSQQTFFMLETLAKFRQKNPQSQGAYASQVAGLMHISPQAMSRLLKTMEERGYIERHIDREDRRNTLITMTPTGEEVHQQQQAYMIELMERVIGRMGTEDMQLLLRLLGKLVDTMEGELNTIDKGES